MTIERGLRLLAGTIVTASVILAVVQSLWWLVLTGFVGLNLLQSGITNWCPAMWIFAKIGLKRCDRPAAKA